MNSKLGRLSGNSVIITGGTQGIGKALVLKFAKEGADVLFCYLSSKELSDNLMSQTSNSSGTIIGFQADIRDREQVEALVNLAGEKFGRVDTLINNAHQPYERKWFEDASWEEFQREIDTLVQGPFNVVQSALPYLKVNGGSIINISSTMAQLPLMQHSFYATAKSALVGLTKSLSLELGKYGIRANVVTPGPLKTNHNSGLPKEMMEQLANDTPLYGRMGTCEEAADSIFLLALPEAGLITGSNIHASGGFSIF